LAGVFYLNNERKTMTKEQKQVAEFMRLAGQEVKGRPEIPSEKTSELRMRLLYEELAEMDIAFLSRDLTETADALGDLLYVLLGAAVACGIDLEPIFQEVHRSNMSKFIDGHRDPGGKWIKGPSYSPANLKPILDIQAEIVVTNSAG
jgi:predicted HAD superfamily Cof-like phosphohydrolase